MVISLNNVELEANYRLDFQRASNITHVNGTRTEIVHARPSS